MDGPLYPHSPPHPTNMCGPKPLLLFFLIVSSLLPLLTSSSPITIGDPNASPEDRWRILTKRNFSSQIRTHPHILLLVTLPWSGESRSLKKNVAKLISENGDKFGKLELMIVHKNSEKMLADVLGAKDDLTLFYYHHSKRFKYQGRMDARSIIESISYTMSFKHQEVPLESLHLQDQLEKFLKSTDEAVFLLEFCGWSARVMQNMDTEGGDFFGENITIDDETLRFGEKGKLKGPDNGEHFCSIENELIGTPWIEGMSWTGENISFGEVHGSNGKFDCSRNEFKWFESFFLNFTKVIRETFLPPERLRFGHISETSLLPLIGIKRPKNWLLLRWISGCPNCSQILEEGDDLRSFMQMDHSLIVDLDGDRSTRDFAFPANEPSIILFIDRSSESSKISEESKNALDVFRRFVHENQISSQKFKGCPSAKTGTSMHDSSRRLSKRVAHDGHPFTNPLSGHKIIKVSDQMTFMVVDESGKLSLQRATAGHDNTVYDLLAHLLQKKDPTLRKAKFSLIAKQAGFQLVSNDFEVKVVDSATRKNGNGHLVSEMKSAIFPSHDATSDSPVNAMEGDQIVHRDSSLTEVEDIEQVGNSAPQLDKEDWLKEKTDEEGVLKDEKCFSENDNGLDYNHSRDSSCNGQNLPKTEDHSPKEYNHKDGNNLNESSLYGASSYGDGQSYTYESTNLAYHQEVDMQMGGMEVGTSTWESTDAPCPQEADFHMGSMETDILKEKRIFDFEFSGSYFVSDGGYRILGTLTGDTKLPSLVILDPAMHQHYVLSTAANFSYSSLVSFVANFLKGELSPYQRSEWVPSRARQIPQPPFVNLDFHEADAIPRVTAESFSELVLGCSQSDRAKFPYFKEHCGTGGPKRDALVLFTQSWCGFCLRMELIVREVYRAFEVLTIMSKNQRMWRDLAGKQDKFEEISRNLLPSIFYMDCSWNDCTFFLDSSSKRDVYPTLVLFPAGKDAISYEGDISVNGVFEFIAAYGSSSWKLMNEYRGILWTQRTKASKAHEATHDVSPITLPDVVEAIHDVSPITLPDVVAGSDNVHEQPVENPRSEEKHHDLDIQLLDGAYAKRPNLVVGSILSATDKLASVFPFDNSSILIVKADQNVGFQGVILNKRMTWNVFLDMDETLSALKEAPFSYGGPVKTFNLPLVSLTRKAIEGYSEVIDGLYFGDPVATSLLVEAIRSGNQSAVNFWFFLGFSGWEWNQLFGEIARGDWNLSEAPLEKPVWPEV